MRLAAPARPATGRTPVILRASGLSRTIARDMTEPAIYLLTGVPASGKSTVGALLARRFARGVHIDGDVIRDMVVSGRVDMSPDPPDEAVAQLRLRYRRAAALAQAHHEEGFTVVWQDSMLGPFLEECVEMLEGLPVHVIVLAPDAETVAARDAARDKTAYGGTWTVAEMDAGFRETTPRIGHWIDSSGQTPAETVDEILRLTGADTLGG